MMAHDFSLSETLAYLCAKSAWSRKTSGRAFALHLTVGERRVGAVPGEEAAVGCGERHVSAPEFIGGHHLR